MSVSVPDWADTENLYLITRSELVAKKLTGEFWKVKTVRCNKCGNCCKSHPITGAYFPVKEDGSCINLVSDGKYSICSLGMEKPLACALGEPEGDEYTKFNCCIEYK